MRAFLALIDKEWRDARPLTIACAAIVLIVSWSYHEWVLRQDGPEATVMGLVPGLITLFAALLAADLVASDRKTGVLRTLSMLPVPMRQLWLAKVTFFTVAVAVFAVWVIDCQVVVLLLGGDVVSAGQTLERLGEGLIWYGHGLLFVMAILLCSTVGLRSFASVLVGVALAVGAWMLMRVFDRALGLELAQQETLAAMAAAFLFASLVVFVRGRIQAGRFWRPAALGLGVAVPALLLTLTVSSVQAEAALEVDPRAEDTLVSAHYLSPSAEHLAILVSKAHEGFGSGFDYRANRIWVVRTEDGHLTQLPGRMRHTAGWSAEGLLHFAQWNSRWGYTKGVQWLEPGSWKHRGSVTNQPAMLRGAASYLSRGAPGPTGSTTFTSRVSGLSVDLDACAHAFATRDGLTAVYTDREGGVHALHLLTRAAVEFECEGRVRPPKATELSDDGAFLMLYANGQWQIYEMQTGKRRFGPWDGTRWSWLRGAQDSARILVEGEDGAAVVHELGAGTSVEIELSPRTPGKVEYLVLPTGGYLALVQQDGFVRTVERLAPDGSFERQLFPPER